MWIVYYVEGKTVQFGSTRTYVGSTEVRDGETLKMAADRRVDAHKDVGGNFYLYSSERNKTPARNFFRQQESFFVIIA